MRPEHKLEFVWLPIESHRAPLTQAGQRVHAIDVHGAATTDTLSATPAEGQSRIQLVLDAHQGVEHHGSGLVEVESVGLHARLFGRGVGVPAVNLEGLEPRLFSGRFRGGIGVVQTLGVGHRCH